MFCLIVVMFYSGHSYEDCLNYRMREAGFCACRSFDCSDLQISLSQSCMFFVRLGVHAAHGSALWEASVNIEDTRMNSLSAVYRIREFGHQVIDHGRVHVASGKKKHSLRGMNPMTDG